MQPTVTRHCAIVSSLLCSVACARGDLEQGRPPHPVAGFHEESESDGTSFVALPDPDSGELLTEGSSAGDTDGTTASTDAGSSSGDTGSSGTGVPQHVGPCCEPMTLPLCLDGALRGCVCQHDASCCVDAWDATCVAEIESFGCGHC
jgi:hypothetical protein